MHLFKHAASTRNLTITSTLMLVAPLLYLFIDHDLQTAAPVLSAIYTPVVASLTLYFVYRQMRLAAALRLDQEHAEQNLRRLEFARYWRQELKERFSTPEKIHRFKHDLSKYQSHPDAESSTSFKQLLVTNQDFLLTHQLYLILLQLRQGVSDLDTQAFVQAQGLAFSVLPPDILHAFEMALVLNGGSAHLHIDQCVFVCEADFRASDVASA